MTGKPILYVGMGEKLSDLEQFYPDRMASRILGMGDIMSIIDKATAVIDERRQRSFPRSSRRQSLTTTISSTRCARLKRWAAWPAF